MDAWSGWNFLKTLLVNHGSSAIAVDWIAAIAHIYVPSLALCIGLIQRSETWWSDGLVAGCIAVICYFAVYLVACVYFESKGCMELINSQSTLNQKIIDNSGSQSLLPNNLHALHLLVARSSLSGVKKVRYLTMNTEQSSPQSEFYEESKRQTKISTSTSFYSRLTLLLSRYGVFIKLHDPKRLYSVDEISEQSPLINKVTWSLEKIFCRNLDKSCHALVTGKDAVTPTQLKSSIACFTLGIFLKISAVNAIVIWLTLPTILKCSISGIYMMFSLRELVRFMLTLKAGLSLKNSIEDEENHDGMIEKKSIFIYDTHCQYRITEPTLLSIRIVVWFRVTILLVFPTMCLFLSKNIPVGVIFVFLSILNFVSDTFNVWCYLQEFVDSKDKVVHLDGFGQERKHNKDHKWQKKHRYRLMARKHPAFWIKVFTCFMVIFAMLFTLAFIVTKKPNGIVGLKYTSDFVYPGVADKLMYPTSPLEVKAASDETTSLLDFAWLARVSFESNGDVSESLDTWFKSEGAKNHADVVETFKKAYEAEIGRSSDIEYKYIGFPQTSVGIVSVRGSLSFMELIVNMQLWLGSFFSVILRFSQPCGETFTPIFEKLIRVLAFVESDTLKKISYYQETTAFVNYLKDEGIYNDTVLVGHCT